MNGLTDFERAVLEKLFAGEHAALAMLRAQAAACRLVSREITGVGFFLSFDIPEDVPVFEKKNFTFGDVNAEIDGLQNGAGFVVFVSSGWLSLLEGYCYDERWPNAVRGFSLAYVKNPRELSLPR